MPDKKIISDGGGAGSAQCQVGNDSARLIVTFTDLERQHAGFILGVQLSRSGEDERDRAFPHNPFNAPARWRVWVFNRGLVDNPAFADETADQHGKRAVLV